MKKQKYQVVLHYTISGSYFVKAANIDKAIELAREKKIKIDEIIAEDESPFVYLDGKMIYPKNAMSDCCHKYAMN